MNLELLGQRALVSGASRGIGKAIALGLAREGVNVCLVARNADDLRHAAQDVAACGPLVATASADVTTSAGADAAIATAVEKLGGLDIVVCNVGKSFARNANEMDDADFETSMATNLRATVNIAQRAAPHLRASGGGAMTFISSIWGREAGGAPGYNVAKAGVQALAKALAHDYAADNIRVNSVAPGSILFPGGGWDRRRAADPAGIAAFVARELPFGRFGTPEEIADVVVFLSSRRASWVSGAAIVVDGCQSRAF